MHAPRRERRRRGGDAEAGGGADGGDRRGARARRGSWQAEARAKLDAGRAAFEAARARRPKLPRAELEARVAALKSDARHGQQVATFFRKRKTTETTDEELEALLDEVEALAALDQKKKDPA